MMATAAPAPTRWLRSAVHDWPNVLHAWQVSAEATGPEWAAEHRVLTAQDSSEPGPWNNARTPYLIGIMAALGDPAIREVCIVKPVQSGGSEALRNAVARWIDVDPGDVLLVLQDELTAKRVLRRRFKPMLETTPRLARYLTNRPRDLQGTELTLLNCWIRNGWAGSASLLATDPFRYVILDETDKYPQWTAKEADPVSLARARTTTYRGREKIAVISTPTTTSGYIWQAREASPVVLRYHVPCPHCGAYQLLVWAQVRYPKTSEYPNASVAAEAIDNGDLAVYQCIHCRQLATEADKPTMIRRGVWAPGDAEVTRERILELAPKLAERFGRDRMQPWGHVLWTEAVEACKRLCFHYNALYSPWRTWSSLAAQYIRALGRPARMMAFWNEVLAEAFEEERSAVRVGQMSPKIKAGHKAGIVPAWAGCLIAAADTQRAEFWYTIRAWGAGYRSRLVDYGLARTFDDLRKVCLDTAWPVEDQETLTLTPRLLLIDAGGTKQREADESRTAEVYQFALTDPARILATRGHGGGRPQAQPFRMLTTHYTPPGARKAFELSYLRIDHHYYSDVLAARVRGKPDAPDAWELHEDVDLEYTLQLSSQHKVPIHRPQLHFVWQSKTEHTPDHLWDCEKQQCAGAELLRVQDMPNVAQLVQARRLAQQRRAEPAEPLTTPDGRPYLVTDRD